MPSHNIDHVVLIHGYGVSSENLWFPWLHEELEKRNIRVTAPTMPNPLRPDYKKWMKLGSAFAAHWTPRTLVIGHSLGGPFSMRLLQHAAKGKVGGVILISPLYAATLSVKPLLEFFEKPIDWELLRERGGRITVIHAKNDPLVPFDHGLRYAECLGAKMHLFTKGGHLRDKRFPFLLKTVESYLK